jgi:hypothetical protein
MKKKLFPVLALALVMVSCAPSLRVHYFRGAPDFRRTSPESVELLRYEPRGPHVAFAEIRYNPSARMSRGEVEWRLRRKGAAIGANALVIEEDTLYRDRVWAGPYRDERRRPYRRNAARDHYIVAIAIRYR